MNEIEMGNPAAGPISENESTGHCWPQGSVKPSPVTFWEDPVPAPVLAPVAPLPSPPTTRFDFSAPPGIVGELYSYFYASARYPMREGALLAALGFMAGIAGRAFNFEGTGLNLYLLLLAESGRGKEDMRAGIDRVLASARVAVPLADEFIGPDTFASGQGLVRTLEDSPSFLSIQSEFGLRLKELNDPRASSALVVMRRVLLDIYAKSDRTGVLRSTVYSDREKNTKVVHAPCVSILGESTPGHVFDNLSFRDIEDGLLPRCLLLECSDKRPRANANAGCPPEPGMVARLNMLMADSLGSRRQDRFTEVMSTDEAKTLLKELQNRLDDEYNDEARDHHERALRNRAGLNIRRISALIAVGCVTLENKTPTIQAEHVRWATEFVEHAVNELARKFRDGIVGAGEARQEAELKKYVFEYIRMPAGRKAGYKVPKRLAEESVCIGLDYFRRRARRCAAFTQDRRGFERALSDALNALCRAGSLYKLPPQEVFRKFALRGEVYVISDIDTWIP